MRRLIESLVDTLIVLVGVTTLVFCPRERGDVTTIHGVIQVDSDTGFLGADWSFTTPVVAPSATALDIKAVWGFMN